VAGSLKNRRLKFPNVDGLRPTSDQLKETIFNWLAPYIYDSICIDAFSGSGSLGIESISRGAKTAIFYEINSKAITQIKQNLESLEVSNYKLYKKDSVKSLASIDLVEENRIIVFLDPPFNKNIMDSALTSIRTNNNISSGTIVYVETEKSLNLNLDDFEVIKAKDTSNISAKLLIKI
jgi:16S rRNA (guanine966-N2)-methyltransferase